jgi:hypothetical protein
MNRHHALQERLAAIEAQLALRPTGRPLPSLTRRYDAADAVSPVLQALLAEVLPGAMVLDWRQDTGGHAGRMAADGLVYRFRVDGGGVSYRPAWDGVLQRGWEMRSDSFLELRDPALYLASRMDFRGGKAEATAKQKRKCTTGYSCGASCISLQKECRITPGSAIGKARLRRLQQLAAAGDKAAAATVSQVKASRGAMASERQKERNVRRVEKLLARPEIAEYLRTGKLPEAASASTEPGTVRNMKPGEIVFDPTRFQYKINATADTGDVGSLSGVRKWDPNLAGVMSVWKDPADGKVYVVNGHNRLNLANRLGAEEVTVRFLNAKTATEARAIGAMQNIAEGAGTPMDAAKFFRDTGIKTQADVEAKGLPLRSGQAEKGLKLSKLPDEVFNAVVRGDLSVNRGAIIGGSGLDEAKQREVFKLLRTRKGIADKTLLELVEHAAASEQRTQTTIDLFGMSQEAKDNLFTRAKLAAGLKAKIAREKRLFGTVSKTRAASTLAEKAGNVINQEQSARVAGEASEALSVFERLKSSSGPISSALNRAADRVEAGESETKVRQELERDVFAAVEAELVAAGLRKRPRADSLRDRMDALRRRVEAPGQLGLSLGASPSAAGKGTGEPCGQGWISRDKDCHKEGGGPVDDRPIGQRKGPPKRQGSESERPPGADSGTSLASRANDARRRLVSTIGEIGGLDEKTAELVADYYLAKPKDGGAGVASLDPAIGQFNIKHGMFMDREAINHFVAGAMQWDAGRQRAQRRQGFLSGLSSMARGKAEKALDVMVRNSRSGYVTRQELVEERVSEGFAPITTGKGERRLANSDGVFLTLRDITTTGMDYATHLINSRQSEPVLTNPGRQDPGLAPKVKLAGLNAQDVTSSSQQAAFARQQQQAAKAAGDQQGAQAWRKEERTVERNRLSNAIATSNESQSSLFGVTEYDESMPLFQQQSAPPGPRRRRDAAADILQLRIDSLSLRVRGGYMPTRDQLIREEREAARKGKGKGKSCGKGWISNTYECVTEAPRLQ